MIKINSNNILSSTLNDYFNLLNPTNKNKSYNQKNSLIGRLNNKISDNSSSIKLFYEFILDKKNNYTLLKEIITCKPEELEDYIIPKIKSFCCNNSLNITSKKDEVLSIFGYSNLRENETGIWISKTLNVRICPYCNREYTFNIKYTKKKKDKIKLLFDFDHFLSKDEYPYLSVSFYNLIPSCSICNSRFKGSTPFLTSNNIHPHVEAFHKNVTFTLNTKNASFVEGNPNKETYTISFKNIKDHIKEKNNIDIFKLDIIYNEHKDYIDELIKKFYIYNQLSIDELYSNYKNLFTDKNELITTIFGNYLNEEDWNKRPLAKLTRDIYNELNDLKNGKIII